MAKGTSKTKEVDSIKNSSRKKTSSKKTSSKKTSSPKNISTRNTSSVKRKSPQKNRMKQEKEQTTVQIVNPKTVENRFEFTEKLPDIVIVEEKPKKKKSFFFPILECVFILVILISSCFTIYFIHAKNDREKEYQLIVQKEKSIQKDLNILNEDEKHILSDLDMYYHLDEKVQETQKEYFSLIKQLEDDILEGKTERKIAYLTFDDGPYYNTYRVLDILDQYGVKATFFTTNINGEYCYDNKEVNCWDRYQQYVNRGHTIANHTYTHAIFRGLYSSTDSFMDAVIKQEELIKEKTGGYTTNILRFPGGSSTARGLQDSIKQQLRERGYGWVDWTANDGDGGNLSSVGVAWNNFTSTINSNIEVVLYHDYNYITTDLLPEMIEYLQNNGYELYPLFYESHMIEK